MLVNCWFESGCCLFFFDISFLSSFFIWVVEVVLLLFSWILVEKKDFIEKVLKGVWIYLCWVVWLIVDLCMDVCFVIFFIVKGFKYEGFFLKNVFCLISKVFINVFNVFLCVCKFFIIYWNLWYFFCK